MDGFLRVDESLFRRVVKTTFNQRRKTLRNNIKPLLSWLDSVCVQGGGVAPDHKELLSNEVFNMRPEQLSVRQFVALTNKVSAEYNSNI